MNQDKEINRDNAQLRHIHTNIAKFKEITSMQNSYICYSKISL